ncbi:MAG: phosphoribosylformylglycinamidine cyclo-ligase [Hydrotalea sp.]|nr:phosphoribosylformylglycinamidine cyclo-ligase [Hydrotalea sp.]
MTKNPDAPNNAPNDAPNDALNDAYARAGVDITAGNDFADAIGVMAQKTHQPFLRAGIGGFAAVLDMAKTGFRDPLLMLSCDGVGTKLDLAIAHNHFAGIGFDLVAMAVNDILVLGATPLAFLDYYATGKLDRAVAEKILASIVAACATADCVLAGGETAEMPGFYDGGKLDLAGFVMGAVERENYDKRPAVVAGDKLLGLASSGFHSNGFSLIRQMLKTHKIDERAVAPYKTKSSAENLAHDLLTPTRIYKKIFDAIGGDISAAAHITGGGLLENPPRVFGKNLSAHIAKSSWAMPEQFRWLQDLGKIKDDDMFRSFNCGIGMVLMVAADKEKIVKDKLQKMGEAVFDLGMVETKKTPTAPSVVIE